MPRGGWKGVGRTAEHPERRITTWEPQIKPVSGEREFHSGRHIAALAFRQILTPEIARLLFDSSWHLPTAPTPRKWGVGSVWTHCSELEPLHSLGQ